MTESAVKVGDVFVHSYGYDQTNVEFFEVVSVSASGKTAYLGEVKAVRVDDGGSAAHERVVAATGPDRFAEDTRCVKCSNYHRASERYSHDYSDVYTMRVSTGQVKVTPYGSHAYPWDGEPEYQTGAGFGH